MIQSSIRPWALCGLLLVVAVSRAHATQIVISEIHYHPVEESTFNADGSPFLDLSEDVHEFVEIQNTGTNAVDLTGWSLAGGLSYAFPTNASIAAGGYRVIARNPARLATVYSLSTNSVLGPYTGVLGNGSDTVRLRNAAGDLVDAVTYSSQFPWAQSADALGAQDEFTGLWSTNYQYKGRSLQRVSVTWASGDPANWLASPLTGPTPGAAQSVTRTVPKPVVTAQSAVQATDGAAVVRAGNAVAVACTFSATTNLSDVQLEYFLDDINSTAETRTSLAMTDLGSGRYSAAIPGQVDRSILRYRFKANRGDGLEVVSPRADDPQIAPVGTNGLREAWHGYFVTPTRSSTNAAIYDVLISTAGLAQMNTNITQSPLRVTAASAAGLPRSVPYVATNAPQWDGTVPAVFACNGELWDIQIRYHGSRYHRASSNHSYKLRYPKHHKLNGQDAWFDTLHGIEFIEAQKLNRMLGLPASKMRWVDWYLNSNANEAHSEQGEYSTEMLEEYHELQQQLNPGSVKEEIGELYKDVGNRDTAQNNLEGPYTCGNCSPMLANANWTQIQRYEWTFSLQCNGWKGSQPMRDMLEGMWIARGDSIASPVFSTNATQLANTRSWFSNNYDVAEILTSMALLEWMSIWDDGKQNQFYWRRANGKWGRLGWDYDGVMATTSGGMGGGYTQTIYGGENGATNVFDGVNWWKDTFYKCFRTEFNKRLWELNNSHLDPTNLTAWGFSRAATFAASRRPVVNALLSSLGTYYKPNRPVNSFPTNGAAIAGATNMTTSAYSHPQSVAHAATMWEIRTAAGDYESPVLRVTSTNDKTSLAIPYDDLVYGQTYYWRATHIDTNNHPSIVSAETRFTWGTTNSTAGNLVLNEVLAVNRTSAPNGLNYPDYIELRNNSATNIALAGVTLTDNPEVPAKYAFPTNASIAVGTRLLVWCGNGTNGTYDTGFTLDGECDQVLLMSGSNILDSVSFGPQAPDVSIGRITDGTGGWQANTPTPGTANSAKTLGSVASLRINEWLAEPAYGNDWFELYNTDSNVVALAGLYLSDKPASPTTTRIPALSFIEPHGFTKFLADGSDSGGNHCNFQLGKSGDDLVLTAVNGVTAIDTITFSAQAEDVSQGRLPDGTATLVSFTQQTASPAAPNWIPAAVCIHEVLSHSYPPLEDAVELYNPTESPVSIAGWWLSDDRLQPRKYQIPAGTTVPAHGYHVIYQGSFLSGSNAFAFSAWGDEAVLSAVDGSGALTGYGALAEFGLALRNTSFGRNAATGLDADSGGAQYWVETARSFGVDDPASEEEFRAGTGLTNAAPKIGPLAITELMYHPPDATNGADNTANEYIELRNTASTNLDLTGWKLRGDSDYAFPTGLTAAAGSYLLLVSFDPTNMPVLAAFRSQYGLSTNTPVLGPYSATLANSVHNLEITRPAMIDDTAVNILADKVKYRDIAPWPMTADGGSNSLQRISTQVIGNTADNWSGNTPTPGARNIGAFDGIRIVSSSPLPGGVLGVAYSSSMAAADGTAPYGWQMLSGSVPGLSLATNGVLSGIPSSTGTNTFTVQVTDSVGASTSGVFTLTIAPAALDIATSGPLPTGTVGVAYSQSFVAAGGTPPYVWSVTSGGLPGGLTLDSDGALEGAPTAPGTFNFSITVADRGGLTDTAAFSIAIPVPPLTVTSPTRLVNAELGTPYSQALTAIGGTTPYAWTNIGGALPSGLTLLGTGDIGGTPLEHGDFFFIVRLSDAGGASVTQSFALAVIPPPLVIPWALLDDGIVSSAYTQTLAAIGGVPPYQWTVTSGALPGGLYLYAGGGLGGTPTVSGTFSFTATVTDSINTSTSRAFAVTIAASGPLDRFSWDYLPTNAVAGTAFAVKLTARDTEKRIVDSLDNSVNLSAASGAGSLASPILITEITDEQEDQFEIQNVTTSAVNTTGWFVRLGDSTTDVSSINAVTFALPTNIPAGGLIRVSEQNTAGRSYWGSSINWSSSAGIARGWVMLIDADYKPRDFVTLGWDSNTLTQLSIDIGGDPVTTAGQWSGNPLLPGTRGSGTLDSWQRIGTNDTNTAADWAWRHNTSGDATSFGTNNTGLTVPWATSTPVPLQPSSVALASGRFIGYLTITQAVTDAHLTASDTQSHSGVSDAFTVSANADTDSDGMPDAWEGTNSLTVGVNDADLDSDGDGASNLEEFLAGTNPQDPASMLIIRGIAPPASGRCTITWPGVVGKLYRITASTNLLTWTPLVVDDRVIVTNSGTQTYTFDAGDAAQLFVGVEIAPGS